MKRFAAAGIAFFTVLAGCGSETATSTPPSTAAATTTSTAASPGTTAAATTAPLTTYRFTTSLSVVPDEGEPRVVEVLDGEADVETGAMRISGTLAGLPIDLVTDGVSWRDLGDPDLELDAAGVRDFLVFSGLLMPEYVSALLDDVATWEELGTEPFLGAPATRLRRSGIQKGVDWDYGDVAEMNVWRDDETGTVVKFTALFATGDNDGFPLATWEVVERNPEVDIPPPGG